MYTPKALRLSADEGVFLTYGSLPSRLPPNKPSVKVDEVSNAPAFLRASLPDGIRRPTARTFLLQQDPKPGLALTFAKVKLSDTKAGGLTTEDLASIHAAQTAASSPHAHRVKHTLRVLAKLDVDGQLASPVGSITSTSNHGSIACHPSLSLAVSLRYEPVQGHHAV